MDISIEDDGLVIPEVGVWTKKKHHFLARYLQLFSTGMKNKWPQRIYLDLFAGAGYCKIRGTDEIVFGSPLIAATIRDPFTRIIACERDRSKTIALEARLKQHSSCDFQVVNGDANERIAQIVGHIPARGTLCMTFADPYGLHFDFETARVLSRVRSDLVVLLADNMDALRNWSAYYDENPNSSLDRFLGDPAWRDNLKTADSDNKAARLREHYQKQLKSIGFEHFGHERIQASCGQDIYTLLYATRHERGLDFWRKASEVEPGGQRRMF